MTCTEFTDLCQNPNDAILYNVCWLPTLFEMSDVLFNNRTTESSALIDSVRMDLLVQLKDALQVHVSCHANEPSRKVCHTGHHHSSTDSDIITNTVL